MKAEEYISGKNIPCIRLGDPKQDTAWFYPYDTLIEMMEEYAKSQLKERDEKINNLVKHKRNLEKELSKYVSKKVIR